MELLPVKLDDNERTFPNMDLAQKLYQYEFSFKNGQQNHAVKLDILNFIEADNMTPLYLQLCSKFDWDIDETKSTSMRIENGKALEEIESKSREANLAGGDTDILDVLFMKARLASRIGNWTEALEVYGKILNLPKTSTGKKIDAKMEEARVHLFNTDITKLKPVIQEAKKLIDLGGDWDRRNRLKVYEALTLLLTREFKAASELLQDCIATFNCVELCSYEQFMFYAVIAGVICLPRTQLHKKLITNPQVLAIIRDQVDAQLFMNSLYQCEYGDFFKALLRLYPSMLGDRYLGPHVSYLVREMRILAYTQFLEAYKSVMMSTMAASFGISLSLLDKELSRFIASGRITAKIDKVGDIVETSRADKKNAQYQETIKKGDHLLNQIQRLVRVIDV